MTEPETLTIQASGMSFGALAWGDAGAPLALMAHGYPDTAWTWRHLGPALAERGWRAVAPFTRGYAPTGLAPDGRYLIAAQAADLLALHEALGGDHRSALIGHDWGAVATWAATALAPGRFASYVAVGYPPPPALLAAWARPRTWPLAARQAKASWYLLYNQLPVAEKRMQRVVPRLWRDWAPGYDAGEDIERFFAAVTGPGRRRAALGYYRDNLRRGALATFTIKPAAPVLYLHGERDGCAQAGLGELAAGSLPAGSRFELLPGAGHFPQLEQPAVVNELIGDWIGSDGVVSH